MKVKKLGIGILILYMIFALKIEVMENHDVYLRIVPAEKIKYLLIPSKLKSEYNDFVQNAGFCKKLAFSNKRILFSKNGILYETILNEDKAETKIFIPEYSYTVTDDFNLELSKDDSNFYQMVCFSITENDEELFAAYFTVCNTHGIVFKEYTQKKIYELLCSHKDAVFKITECRE